MLRLMPTGGDVNLELQKAVLIFGLIDGLKINFGHILTNEVFARAHRTTSVLPFLCLIMKLCRKANVPLLKGVDNEI